MCIFLSLILSIAYLSIFILLGLLMSSLIRKSSLVLLILLAVWISLVFIIPNVSGVLSGKLAQLPSELQTAKQMGPMIQEEVWGKIAEVKERAIKGEFQTKEEILAMKPGRELNIRVAEEIIGHNVIEDEIFGDMEVSRDDKGNSVYQPLRRYSEDISEAQIVVNKMIKTERNEALLWANDSRPEVICKAALVSILEKKKAKEKRARRAKFRVIK